MPKIIQITSCVTEWCQGPIVHALDDEGTVWWFDNNSSKWNKFPELPNSKN